MSEPLNHQGAAIFWLPHAPDEERAGHLTYHPGEQPRASVLSGWVNANAVTDGVEIHGTATAEMLYGYGSVWLPVVWGHTISEEHSQPLTLLNVWDTGVSRFGLGSLRPVGSYLARGCRWRP